MLAARLEHSEREIKAQVDAQLRMLGHCHAASYSAAAVKAENYRQAHQHKMREKGLLEEIEAATRSGKELTGIGIAESSAVRASAGCVGDRS